MKSKIHWLIVTIATVLTFSTSALGWSPYGYGPPQGFGPPWAAPGQAPGDWQTPPQIPRLRVERSADQGNYYVTILVTGMEPAAVTVAVEGNRFLAISTEDSRESTYENSAEDGSGYYRSFSYSSGSTSRRIGLPPDADVAALQRQDGEGEVRITIPRRH